jgi:clathrin heavy chain
MAPCQIMNYDVDANEEWCFLVGLYSPDQKNICSQMQLYNVERRQQQLLEGYAGCFMSLPVCDPVPSFKNSLFAFCEKKQNESVHRLHIMEIGAPAPNQPKFKINAEISMAADAIGDFPVLMQCATKYGLIFIITKLGYFFMYETSRAALVYRQRITDQLIFVAVKNTQTDGMVCINKVGQVFAINVEDQNLVKFVMSAQHIPDNRALAIKMASRYGLAGADDIFMSQFNQCLASGDYAGAARTAAQAPTLRTAETINKFKSLPPPPQGGPQPVLIYFSTLLETVTLNEQESLELCRPVLQQGKVALVEDWINKNKLTMSDELGDAIRQQNPQLALKVFQNSGSPDKVIQGLVEANQFDKIVPYCQ